MSDFNKVERPFVAGSLIGLRCFDIEPDGTLTGPVQGSKFKPGDNRAVCAPGMIFYAPPSNHRVAGKGCGCGFYAYHDGSNSYAHKMLGMDGRRIEALIEGFGTCSVGDRGFRAEQARLVAMVLRDPKAMPKWCRLAQALNSPWVAGGCAGLTTLTTIVITNLLGASLWYLFSYLIPLLCLMGVAASFHGITCEQGGEHHDKVRRKYPGVPVYHSKAEMLKAHPLSDVSGFLPPPPKHYPDISVEGDTIVVRSARGEVIYKQGRTSAPHPFSCCTCAQCSVRRGEKT